MRARWRSDFPKFYRKSGLAFVIPQHAYACNFGGRGEGSACGTGRTGWQYRRVGESGLLHSLQSTTAYHSTYPPNGISTEGLIKLGRSPPSNRLCSRMPCFHPCPRCAAKQNIPRNDLGSSHTPLSVVGATTAGPACCTYTRMQWHYVRVPRALGCGRWPCAALSVHCKQNLACGLLGPCVLPWTPRRRMP